MCIIDECVFKSHEQKKLYISSSLTSLFIFRVLLAADSSPSSKWERDSESSGDEMMTEEDKGD